ncbi:patatin-like phospholipase family protein [Streptomyces sp. NPDC005574]|uniref:patatin-like phospholipase family protein n=1 Tax=Streptomyces sp. NPDC005574 TaxID=3156891 RepID=UPI0033B9D617
MSRSLVLAGGGMRVAWQTGVVRALYEHGLTFDHIDGTSGGILTTGMLLSGQDPAEMALRWSALRVRDFSSPLPLSGYLRGPWALPALGDADGVIHRVFPALGIDPHTIRSSQLAGTFNLVDFADKTCVAVPHTDIDAQLLAAGMSLPLFLPPLCRDGHVWTDAVWVKDANVGEALRRGADEIWLAWCIANNPYWGDGPLEQYVHMIEMSANGALFAELDAATRPFILHVVKPEYPLPLDPEFFAGRITADTLMEMGYRDAVRYLDGAHPSGVPKDPGCTAMRLTPRGVRYRERLHGTLGGAELVLEVAVDLPLPDGDAPSAGARLVGHVDHQPWGGRVLLTDGRAQTDGGTFTYTARASIAGRRQPLRIGRAPATAPIRALWTRVGSMVLEVGDDTVSTLALGPRDAAYALASVTPLGTHGLHERLDAVADLAATRLVRAAAGGGR